MPVHGMVETKVETTVQYFERQAERCQRELEEFDAAGLKVFELTDRGERDTTEEHRQWLITARDEYRRCAVLFRK